MLSEKNGVEGKSVLFAFVDNCFKNEFRERNRTDSNPPNKIYEFAKDKSYCIFELDLDHKKPYKGKNDATNSNVIVVEEDSAEMEERNKFAKAIGISEDKYMLIDKYYVKPKEYDEMLKLLEKENVLVITGDPGIGKTYTAIHFLHKYYKEGYNPIWFLGLGKEDRDKQKDRLLSFEPQEHDVVYIEDPFGRTVFENREELRTLFSNLVQRFIVSKAKLIITSRVEVFKQYEQEVLDADQLLSFQKELNVRKPSYSIDNLIRIAECYLKAYTNWWNNKKLVGVVFRGIRGQKLISPLMIYNLTKNFSTTPQKKILVKAVNRARKVDLVSQLADEIKMLSVPAKILLYMVLLYGRKNIAIYMDFFDKVQSFLFNKTHFECSTLSFELNKQVGHRIQRSGFKELVCYFSHPAYEEALISLSENNNTCHLIAETCFSFITKEDGNLLLNIFMRFIMRYPLFLEQMMNNVEMINFSGLNETDKLELTLKMILSQKSYFHELARKIYPINELMENLKAEGNSNIFILRIRVLNIRKEEIGNAQIEWSQIFTTDRIKKLDPLQFLKCYEIALGVEDQLMKMIEKNLEKEDVVKKFILLPTNDQRERFDKILRSTIYCGLYQDLNDKIPDEINNNKNNRSQYSRILKKYILKKEAPKGCVLVDSGAMRALKRGAKLYPIGVIDVVGEFKSGDVVYLSNSDYSQKILSMVDMSSSDMKKYKGYHSTEIYNMAGEMISTVISRSSRRESPIKKRKCRNTQKEH